MNNKNQKPNNPNNGNIDETVEKAKSEINAQTDSMLREIEERRQRRLARQREMEQQIQAEEEAKARRLARLKAHEAANADLKKASSNRNAAGVQKPVPTVSSSDSVFSNAHRQQPDAIENFSSAPSASKNTQSRPQRIESDLNASSSPANTRRRTMISSGETQVMPKISEAVPPSQKRQNTAPSNQKRVSAQNSSKPSDSAHVSRASKSNEQAFKRRQAQNTVSANSASQSAGRAPVKRGNSSAAKQKNTHKEVNMMKEIRDWVIAIVIAVAVALLIRNFVFTLVKVQGESMQPTLQENDRLYVNRLFYTPKKGDVVIFKPSSDPKRPYVKRVIATEGDTVYIDFETGDVYVNDQVIDEPYIKAKTTRSGSYIAEQIASGNYSKDNPIVIEKGKIFVMGDNRNNSRDSREIGQVPKSELIGGAVFRFWPLNKFGSVSYKATTSYLIEDENMNFRFVA